MSQYDIAIIGTGPAGLEAAVTAKIRNQSVLLLGQRDSSDKVSKAHTIENYLGLPSISGADLARAYIDHLDALDISITEDRINTVYAMGEYFYLQGHKEDYQASSVILACGVSAAKPLPGELEYLGRGVSYCATCDAGLYRNKTAIVVAYAPEDEAEAAFLAERAARVYYLPQYDYAGDLGEQGDKIEVIEHVKPLAIEKEQGETELLTDGDAYVADGVFLLRSQIAPSQLVPGLQMEGNHVAVDRQMRTNLKGLYACGDITGSPYQYIKAAGEGNVAALSAVSYLGALKKKRS